MESKIIFAAAAATGGDSGEVMKYLPGWYTE